MDEYKREIENLAHQVSKLQEKSQSSVSKNPETNVMNPKNISVSNNSNEVKEYLKQVQKEGTEISPFLRSFLVPPK
jgi:predicted RNase H-like nuclease (RuvC/YqgF family)